MSDEWITMQDVLDREKKEQARLAELESERDSLQAQLTQYGFVIERAKELEAEVEKLRKEHDQLDRRYEVIRHRAMDAEAKLAEVEKRLKDQTDDYVRSEARLGEVEKDAKHWHEKCGEQFQAIERARELAEAFLADVQSSLGPDPHAFDDPETCAKDALALVREIARLFSGKAEKP